MAATADLDPRWHETADFTALLSLNMDFLRGRIESTPYHCGPIDEETKSLVPSLLKLHEKRIFTWNSQPYVHEFSGTRSLTEARQRPTISFIMSEEDGPLKVFQELKKRRGIKTNARRVHADAPLKGSFTKKMIVTKYRISDHPATLAMHEWKVLSVIAGSTDMSGEDLFELKAMKEANPWMFEVVATSWDQDINLADIVLTAVEAIKSH